MNWEKGTESSSSSPHHYSLSASSVHFCEPLTDAFAPELKLQPAGSGTSVRLWLVPKIEILIRVVAPGKPESCPRQNPTKIQSGGRKK
jgi:hypothetical protein